MAVLGELPEGSTLQAIDDSNYIFAWTPTDCENISITFFAKDTMDATATLIPTVELCCCQNEGECLADEVIAQGQSVVLQCLCPEGV